jgi:hypothetical protein
MILLSQSDSMKVGPLCSGDAGNKEEEYGIAGKGSRDHEIARVFHNYGVVQTHLDFADNTVEYPADGRNSKPESYRTPMSLPSSSSTSYLSL